MKKIIYYVSEIANFVGYEDIVSAHIQYPLKTLINIVDEYGDQYDTYLVTNKLSEMKSRPSLWSKLNKTVKFEIKEVYTYNNKNPSSSDERHLLIISFFLHLYQLMRCIKKGQFDIVHFWGGRKVLFIAVLFKCLFIRKKIIYSLTVDDKICFFSKHLARILNMVVLSSSYQMKLFTNSRNIVYLPPFIKALRRYDREKTRVTFWRDPTSKNGADIAVDLFNKLAKEFPDIIFTFAVRQNVENLISNNIQPYSNIEYYEVPYPDSISIDLLLSESMAIFLPFRSLTTHPQLAILESAIYEVPVICSKIKSNIDLEFEVSNIKCCHSDDYEKLIVDVIKSRQAYPGVARQISKYFDEKKHASHISSLYGN